MQQEKSFSHKSWQDPWLLNLQRNLPWSFCFTMPWPRNPANNSATNPQSNISNTNPSPPPKIRTKQHLQHQPFYSTKDPHNTRYHRTKLMICIHWDGGKYGQVDPKLDHTTFSYLLMTPFSSTTLHMILKPSLEIPRWVGKYSTNATKNHERPLIIHVLLRVRPHCECGVF